MMASTQRLFSRFARSALILGVAATCACTSGSGSGEGEPEDEPHGPIDFTVFGQDRHVVGGDWYLYDEEGGHTLDPFPTIYVLRESSDLNARYAAFQIDSYYDPDTGDSGPFSFRYSLWSGAMGWTAEESVMTPNVKSGDFCFDFFGGQAADCSTTEWQAVFRIYRFLVQTGPIVVARPGVFARTRVGEFGSVDVLARSSDGGLEALPDPTGLPELVDEAASGWDDPLFDFTQYAADLPDRGRMLGPRFVDDNFTPRPDVYMMLAGLEDFVRFTMTPAEIGNPAAGVVLKYTVVPVNPADKTIDKAPPSRVEEETIDTPNEGEVVFVDFMSDGARLPGAELAGTSPPDIMPDETTWQLALEQKDGAISIRTSPAAALFNGTRQSSAQSISALPPVE